MEKDAPVKPMNPHKPEASELQEQTPWHVLCLLPEPEAMEAIGRCLGLLERPCRLHWPVTDPLASSPQLDTAALADMLGSLPLDLVLTMPGTGGAPWGEALEILEGLRPDLFRLELDPGALAAGRPQEHDWRQRYTALAEASCDCMLRLDARGRVLFANSMAATVFGVAPDACQGQGLDSLGLEAEALELLWQKLGAVFKNGEDLRFCWHSPGNGEERWMEAVLHPETWSGQRPATVLALLRDITETRKTEEALGRSEQMYRFSFEQAAIGMVHTDLHGVIRQANASFASMLGCTVEELVGQRFEDITHPEDRDKSDALRRSLERTPWGVASLEKRYLRKDGSICWGRAHVSIVTNSLGRPLYFVAQVEDISESKRLMESLVTAKEQAEAASKAKSQFLSNMNHELRTPLNAIIGMTQLALGGNLEHEQREQLESALRASRSLLAAVNRLLEFSTLESRTYAVQDKPFSLRERLEPILESLAREAWAKGLYFNYAFGADVPAVVCGDADKIVQVLVNIVQNAIKFTEGGKVSVGVSCDACTPQAQEAGEIMLQFSVKDSGVGIPKDKQESIFEPFSLAEDVLTKRYGGIGLGLAVCRQLVEHMGGRIWVRSKPGQGSAFFFTCPAKVVAASGQPARGGQARPRAERSYAILVAEDEPINQELTRKLLQRRGHSVTVASDGQQALQLLQRSRFDLVLMDIQMPHMNGLDAAQLIREGAVPGVPENLPVIALTAYAAEEDRQLAIDAGMDAFVAKPFEAGALAQVIREVMAGHGR